MMERKGSIFFMFLAVLLLAGCPDDDAGAADEDAGAGGAGGGADPCAEIDCGGHGTCGVFGGLIGCTCDDGFTLQGLECVELDDTGNPPADFSCPAPGGTGDLFTTITQGRWAYVQSDRSCTAGGVRDIYQLRADGIFTIRSQFGEVASGRGGTLLYGCWSVVESQADRLIVTYDFAVETNRNCGPIAGHADPPACTGAIAHAAAEDALWLITNEEQNQERILFFRAPADPPCGFCGDDASCCPHPSWVADASGPLCD